MSAAALAIRSPQQDGRRRDTHSGATLLAAGIAQCKAHDPIAAMILLDLAEDAFEAIGDDRGAADARHWMAQASLTAG